MTFFVTFWKYVHLSAWFVNTHSKTEWLAFDSPQVFESIQLQGEKLSLVSNELHVGLLPDGLTGKFEELHSKKGLHVFLGL